MEIYNYEVPSYYLPYFINGDSDNLNDSEFKEITVFENKLLSKHGHCHVCFNEDLGFKWSNDINNLGGDVSLVSILDKMEGK